MSKLDLFAEANFGKAAWRKLGNVPENFRLYRAAWLGKRPKDWKETRVTGREFMAGKHGDLDIPVPNTIRSAVVTREEMQAEGYEPYDRGTSGSGASSSSAPALVAAAAASSAGGRLERLF